MAETKKPSDNKRIIDVEHPGKSAPSPNSKAVIITNRPILKDPMVVTEENAVENSDKAALTKKSESDNKVTPLTAPPLPDDSKQPDDNKNLSEAKSALSARPVPTQDNLTPPDDKSTEDKSSETPVEADPAESNKPAEPNKNDRTDNSVSAPAGLDPTTKDADDDAQSKTANLSDNKNEAVKAEDEEAAKHQAEVEKLISSKQYFLPITTNEERRSKHFLILGILFSVLLVALWVDVALDAHLIHINGVKPLTHFFSS